MTGNQLRRIRQKCGMSAVAFGRAIGYGGKGGADDTIARKVRELEGREDDIPEKAASAALRLKDIADAADRITAD